MGEAVTEKRAQVGLRTWAAWALLTTAAWGAVAFVTVQGASASWSFRSVMTPYWMLYIEMVIAPAVMIVALAMPIMALTALLFRRFHVTALVGVAVCAVLLFAYAGLEAYWAALPPDDFPNGWFTSPGLDAAPPSNN